MTTNTSGPQTEIKIEEEIMDLIPSFLQSREADFEKLKTFFDRGQYLEMGRIAHTIKGIARPYGFPTLETYARQLEDLSRNPNPAPNQIEILLNEMAIYLERWKSAQPQ